MSDKATVFDAFIEVQRAVESIGKNRRVTEGSARFQFRGVDDVMAALHEPMAKAGLICVPVVTERLQEARQTRNGGTMNVTHVRVEFTFYGPDGSTFTAATWGEGQDSGDKSTGKAHSMAYKSALLQAFHIPVEDTPDADYDTTPAAPVEKPDRKTDLEWIAGFDTRILLAAAPSEVRGLWAEYAQMFAEGKVSQADSTRLQKDMTARAEELKAEPVDA